MDGFNRFRTVGKYKISNICLQTYPCKHYITFENGETEMMSGDEIYRLFKSEGLYDKHIDSYAEFVRQRDFPTPEEIKEREDDRIRMQQITEKRAKEENERQQIVNQYKASSRLEKLKNKNNISLNNY